MEKWQSKVCVVTGASSGIGAEIVNQLLNFGVNVVGMNRNIEKVQELSEKYKDTTGKLYAVKCDVADQNSVKEAFEWVEENLGGVDILINNAGIYKFIRLFDEGDEINNDLKQIVDVNLMGMVYCTRAALKSMKKRDYGYIININSITGHFVPFPTEDVPSYNTYAGSKYAVTATTEVMRQELICSDHKNKIRVTSISPGEVQTEMIERSNFSGSVEEYFSSVPLLQPVDIADGVIYALSTPYRCNVTEITIRPTGERV